MSRQNNLPGLMGTSQRAWLFGFALVASVFILYSLTLTRQYSGDDIQKAMIVESEIPGRYFWHPVNLESELPSAAARVVHPRYFLEAPIAKQLMSLSSNLGWSDRALYPLQINHMVLGLVGIIGLYVGLLRLTRPTMAFALSIGLASSYGWWYYSTHADFVLAGSAFLAVALSFLISLLLTREKKSIIVLSTGLGVAMALSILFFLSSAVFLPVVIAAILYCYWHDLREPRSGILSLSAFFIAFLLTLTFLPGLILLLSDSGQLSTSELIRAAFYSDSSAAYWYRVGLGDIPRVFIGISRSFVQYPPLGNLTPGAYFSRSTSIQSLLMFAWFGIGMVIFILPFVIIAWRWKSLEQYRTIALVLIAWIVIQIPFGIIWVPTEVKWWLVILPAWLMLVGLTSTLYLDSELKYSLGVFGVILFLLFILVINLATVFWPQAHVDLQGTQSASRKISGLSSPDDLIISVSDSDVNLYLPYFENRRVISYPWALVMYISDEKYVRDRLRDLVEDYATRPANVFVYDCSTEEAAELLKALEMTAVSYQKLDFSGGSPGFDTICRISKP